MVYVLSGTAASAGVSIAVETGSGYNLYGEASLPLLIKY